MTIRASLRSRLGRSAKALYYKRPMLGIAAVSPMILCEAFLPSARALFHIKQRFPIADAHYAMGFAFLAKTTGDERHYRRAVHFLEVLESTRCPGYERYGWGYPFDWETRNGTMKHGTPLITSVPYMYEAFREVFSIDSSPKWQRILQLIAEHAAYDYHDRQTSERASSCSYTPDPNDPCGVINASAYRAFVLTRASLDLSSSDYRRIAERNMRFVIEAQNEDGSWYYSTDGQRDFIDHFHTCFVLKALAKIEALTGDAECTRAIERGCGVLRPEPVRCRRTPQAILPQASSNGLPQRTLRLRRVHQSGRVAAWTLRRSGQHSEQIAGAAAPGRSATARSAPGGFCSGGTTFPCIAGHKHKCSGASVSSCARTSSDALPRLSSKHGDPGSIHLR